MAFKPNHLERIKPVWLISILVSIMCVLLVIFNQNVIYKQLDNWKLIPRPERLTELYFSDIKNLPNSYVAGTQQTVNFTIHNVEYQSTIYQYTIIQNGNSTQTPVILGQGSIMMDQNQTKNIEVPVTYVETGDNSQLTVKVSFDAIAFGADVASRQTQTINYFVKEKGL